MRPYPFLGSHPLKVPLVVGVPRGRPGVEDMEDTTVRHADDGERQDVCGRQQGHGVHPAAVVVPGFVAQGNVAVPLAPPDYRQGGGEDDGPQPDG